MWVFIFRVIDKLKRIFIKKLFLSQIECSDPKSLIIDANCVIKGNLNISVGKNVHIYSNVIFWGNGEIIIGDNVDIGNNTIIFASKNAGVYIGSDVLIAANCYIIDSDHGTSSKDLIINQKMSSGKITIGNDVWISENCTILKNSNINNGVVIGAKSLVNSDLDNNSIAVGIPAKVISYRK